MSMCTVYEILCTKYDMIYKIVIYIYTYIYICSPPPKIYFLHPFVCPKFYQKAFCTIKKKKQKKQKQTKNKKTKKNTACSKNAKIQKASRKPNKKKQKKTIFQKSGDRVNRQESWNVVFFCFFCFFVFVWFSRGFLNFCIFTACCGAFEHVLQPPQQ